jgi:hypothetical protein
VRGGERLQLIAQIRRRLGVLRARVAQPRLLVGVRL